MAQVQRPMDRYEAAMPRMHLHRDGMEKVACGRRILEGYRGDRGAVASESTTNDPKKVNCITCRIWIERNGL